MTEALERVEEAAKSAAKKGLPPVHLWHPAHVGDIDIVIRPNGEWLHEGRIIGRPALVRLFSTILRKDPDGICLVTPVEKLRIVVEDAPFVAVAVERRGDQLVFTTNVDDEIAADADHPIRVEIDPATGAPRPYLLVRAGLEALIARPVFYELVEMADETGAITSAGQRFALGAAESAH
ncbi:MAG TPA: DUF1285 domain-containing protein [Caulobacteraceae bacterium]|nr:DUF1285 domain-containing protein [Caulobacteraceae bacterium]